jgi:hypothetical protein
MSRCDINSSTYLRRGSSRLSTRHPRQSCTHYPPDALGRPSVGVLLSTVLGSARRRNDLNCRRGTEAASVVTPRPPRVEYVPVDTADGDAIAVTDQILGTLSHNEGKEHCDLNRDRRPNSCSATPRKAQTLLSTYYRTIVVSMAITDPGGSSVGRRRQRATAGPFERRL